MEERIQRLKGEMKQNRQAYDADLSLRREAQDFILERDVASADYIKRYYASDWNDAQLYHMVLNTGKVDLNWAADLILSLIQKP